MLEKTYDSAAVEPKIAAAWDEADAFRAGANGGPSLWEQHRVEDVATPEAFERDPDLVLRFYDMRRQAIQTKAPNAAHAALGRAPGRRGGGQEGGWLIG